MQTTLEYSRFELSDSLYRDFKVIFNYGDDFAIQDKILQQKKAEQEEEEKKKRFKKELSKEESKGDDNVNASFTSNYKKTDSKKEQTIVDQCINMIFDEAHDNIL